MRASGRANSVRSDELADLAVRAIMKPNAIQLGQPPAIEPQRGVATNSTGPPDPSENARNAPIRIAGARVSDPHQGRPHMAGHSKWANIKHRKAAVDKKRGKIWSKCSRAIMAAARSGGGDPATNLPLRYAIEEAKAANMPKDTIQRAVDKGSGSTGGADFETLTYEGYGPSGVAIFVEALTDNRARTAGDVRTVFSKKGGSMGNPGSVAFMFQIQGADLHRRGRDRRRDAS
jgi:hypothetical protein